MVRLAQPSILLIGDTQHQVENAIRQTAPNARLTSVNGYFDAIAELGASDYGLVLGAAEPIERRPEAAVRAVRELLGDGRLLLFGGPELEALSRKMTGFGADDYLVVPVTPPDLQQILNSPALRKPAPVDVAAASHVRVDHKPLDLASIPLSDILLDVLAQHPGDAPAACVRQIAAMLGDGGSLEYVPRARAASEPEDDTYLVHPVLSGAETVGNLVLHPPEGVDDAASRAFLAELAPLMAKMHGLAERHNRLLKLTFTDELTGVYNRRYFKHFLAAKVEQALQQRFTVTLLLFDIDDFKKYNDRFGHGLGDEILRETSKLMKRCCREHDLVARIGGDEFAVVFWEKEGPRQPKGDGRPTSTRPPQEPHQIFERFQRLMETQDFPGLGASGRGTLTISGGLASLPWDARTAQELITAADDALMFKAKRSKKNTIVLVGSDVPAPKC